MASQLCEKYVCSQLGIENIGDGGWTVNGWAKVKKEWEETFRVIRQLGYALVFIGHSKEKVFKRKDGSEYTCITSSTSTAYNEIIKNMCDIIGYIAIENGERKIYLRSLDDTIDVKCRFPYIEREIPLGYKSLVDAINNAIDKQEKDGMGQYITDKKVERAEVPTFDYDALIAEFGEITGALVQKDATLYAPKITQIIERYLGKGKKVADATPDQAELISLINTEIKEDLN